MEPLGQGGMATVWLARDLKHDRLVAIKLLRPELAMPVGADRFAREIGIVAKLNHPNILGVLDSGIIEVEGLNAPYYVMPHVEGPSLSALLSRGEQLEVNEALRLAAEVADALEFAHSRGGVHRDVKPGNILIQAGHALVADFGVAIALDAATGGRRHTTMAGEVLGTPVYMSPEQASGEYRLDGRSDVYSLGCVLYEMLAGDPPFTGKTPQSMMIAHLSAPPPPLAERRPGISPALAATVHRALEKIPGDRYASAGEFRDALERLRTTIAARRRWWPTVALVVAVAALFWWSPWRRAVQAAPGGDTVVLLSGFRDRSGTLRAESAALEDALRHELQAVPGLLVIDVGDQPELPVDTMRQRYRADWIIRGALDRIGDSVGATVRLLDARNGAEVRSAVLRRASPSGLQSAAMALGDSSLFASVRSALDSVLLERWRLSLGTDSATSDLRRRAREIKIRGIGALVSIGPRRMLEELSLADSLLAQAQETSPASPLPPYERTLLGTQTGFMLTAAHQFFPDSTWIPRPVDALQKTLPFANDAVRLAPKSADTWLARSKLSQWLYVHTQNPAWRDSALRDLRKASTIAGGRSDIWTSRAMMEVQAGLWSEALFSTEQGEAADHLHVNAAELRYYRSFAEMELGRFKEAAEDCRRGAASFPGRGYFVDCEAQVLGRSSRRPADAAQLLRLADSLSTHGVGDITPILPDELRLMAAAILYRAGQQEKATRLYDGVVGGWQGAVSPELRLDAAYARQEMGDLDSALAITASVVQADPAAGRGIEQQPRFASLVRHPGFPAAIKGISPREARRP